jgi:3-deoxy-D-manno-octulosonate 8-phosphate phosphatase (KDO 8-P phosphatase)
MSNKSATPDEANDRASRVKLMIFDIDGVFTDGSLFFTAAGDALKSFNSLDGHGVKISRPATAATWATTGPISP